MSVYDTERPLIARVLAQARQLDPAEDFDASLQLIEQAGRLVLMTDAEHMLYRLERAETVAAFTDPTLLMRARDGATQMRDLLRAASRFRADLAAALERAEDSR